MLKDQVKFRNAEEIKDFVCAIEKIDADVDLLDRRYIIDAKSYLGICALDLSHIFIVRINSDDNDEIEKFKTAIGPYKVVD